jgi:hypothetical protein
MTKLERFLLFLLVGAVCSLTWYVVDLRRQVSDLQQPAPLVKPKPRLVI